MASCSSTISVQKYVDHRSKSCETVCSSNSSCFLQKRKPPNPLGHPLRSSIQKTTGNSVRQRVLSAKLLKLRSIQNQLNDANFHLAELVRENQALKTLQKRQDKALSKYENTSADLPRLLKSHEEEIRTLTERNKLLKKNVKELNELLKSREEELNIAREQLKHLEKLNKDKHLTEREKLLEQVDDLKMQLEKADNQINILNRKVVVESKCYKQKLNAEMSKHKQCQRELSQALCEIDKLAKLIENKELSGPFKRNRFSGIANRQSISLTSLGGSQSKLVSIKLNADDSITHKIPVTDVKLEPILCKIEEESSNNKKKNCILKSPSENIKARLSSAAKKTEVTKTPETDSKKSEETDEEQLDLGNIERNITESEASSDSRMASARSVDSKKNDSSEELPDINLNHLKVSSSGSEISVEQEATTAELEEPPHPSFLKKKNSLTMSDKLSMKNVKKPPEKGFTISRPDSSKKLENITATLEAAITRTIENGCNEFDKKLGDYCSSVVNNVKNCSDAIETHKENLQMAREDTAHLINTFNQTKNLEKNLQNSLLNVGDGNVDYLSEILNEELHFQKNNKSEESNKKSTRNIVGIEDKKKLLATLRAIDNGDSFESMGSTPPKKTNHLMRELFGDLPSK